jgi:NAD(P)-dependent dehydrogenase (short-subunit alcohol dehydrogenase family)
MTVEGLVAFVTGANRGLGRALVDELLARGARRVYAASREGTSRSDGRVVAIRLDVTDAAQAQEAAAAAPDIDLLINNAGVQSSMSVLQSDPAALRRDLDVNYHGTLNVVRAFVAVLERSQRPAIANILSLLAMASMPVIGGYAASKAAAWSLTQSLRGELRAKGIRVHAVLPGPIDTEMTRHFEIPKTPPDVVARGVLEGIEAGQDYIATDPVAVDVLATFLRDPRELERRFAG